MNFTVTDNAMRPYLHVGDEIEFEKSNPITNGRICLVRYQGREKIRQVFRGGNRYRLKPLNGGVTEYVPVTGAGCGTAD